MTENLPEIQSLFDFMLKDTFFKDQEYYYTEIDDYLKKEFWPPQ